MCFRVRDLGVNNHAVTWTPVGGRRDSVSVAELKRINDAQNFVKMAARGGGVGNFEANNVLGIDHKDITHREWSAMGVDICGV